ncbi:branched-chain amino acid ABC transporter permease [Aureimonas populi]|uniref:Branched-chain amino acid ABC transporter permease n=1 Tax=Aureimonas populi TaxID=1701758 RepID=A0ABW5CL97_9HYPH|nr:branched-chain amino acid ABC transporter permease [Aureimonas populi]
MSGLPIVLFDGVVYGMLLFLMSVGLSVTLGLMGVVNLAHGSFAAMGGFASVVLTSRFGVPFLLALPVAAAVTALAGAVLERTLFRRLYRRSALDQVLFTVGMIYVWIALGTFVWGAGQQAVQLPVFLQGQVELPGGYAVGRYRAFLLLVGAAVALAIFLGIERTRFGARVRAAQGDRDMASGIGIRVDRLFAATFALGAALAGLGGALSIPVLGLDPTFPLKYLVFFLIVVCVGGPGTVLGSLVAALAIGIIDVAGKYYAPEIGGFVIYALVLLILFWRPNGIVARA